ncbi:MAG: hypothetical protein FWD61_17015 [Phycisphaerales bacterium]|nr:hypothetical protein [Phycisphaerales bacterium]
MTATPSTPQNDTGKPEPGWADAFVYPLATLGALVGGALGALIVCWAARSGYYALPVVGLFAGWAAAIFSRKGGWIVALIAGLVAVAVGLFVEWKCIARFHEDPSFLYFLEHLTSLKPFILFVHGVNVALALWCSARK